MNKISVSALALVVALGSAMPSFAQETETRIEGETALQMATRLELCGDAGVRSAQFVDVDGATSLQANCVSRVADTADTGGGGLGTGGLVAAGVGIAAVIGIAAASSSSSGTN